LDPLAHWSGYRNELFVVDWRHVNEELGQALEESHVLGLASTVGQLRLGFLSQGIDVSSDTKDSCPIVCVCSFSLDMYDSVVYEGIEVFFGLDLSLVEVDLDFVEPSHGSWTTELAELISLIKLIGSLG